MRGGLRGSWWRRLPRSEGGASAAEFALIFPVFAVLLFGTFEAARVLWTINSMQLAVSQSARYAFVTSTRPSGSNCGASTSGYQTDIKSYLSTQLGNWKVGGASSSVSAPSCGSGPATVTLTITATYTFTSFLTTVFTSSIPLRQVATITVPLG